MQTSPGLRLGRFRKSVVISSASDVCRFAASYGMLFSVSLVESRRSKLIEQRPSSARIRPTWQVTE